MTLQVARARHSGGRESEKARGVPARAAVMSPWYSRMPSRPIASRDPRNGRPCGRRNLEVVRSGPGRRARTRQSCLVGGHRRRTRSGRGASRRLRKSTPKRQMPPACCRRLRQGRRRTRQGRRCAIIGVFVPPRTGLVRLKGGLGGGRATVVQAGSNAATAVAAWGIDRR